MSANFNKAILVGRLGRDPEMKTLENGTVVVNFSMATSQYYRDKAGNRVEKTDWHNIVLWRDQAEIAKKYLTKGSAVLVEGKITYRTWDDKEGKRHYVTEVVGDRINLVDSANKVEKELVQPEQREANISEALEPTTGDDLPF